MEEETPRADTSSERHEPESPTQSGRVTLSDIAQAAGVSRATVSLVLRNSPTIPKRTHELVLQHAEELGYVYNRGAASLRTANTHIVGLVVHDITNPYFAEIVAAIQRELAKQGRVVFLGDTQDSPQLQEEFVTTVREYNVDGIIMSPAAGTDPDWVMKLQRWQLPCVLFSRSLQGVDVDFVGGNNFAGSMQQTEYLLSLGHRRIAFIGANDSISSGRERLGGYRAALEKVGIAPDPALIVTCPATRRAAHDALIRLLQIDDTPTAAVCFNDVAAFGAILALQNLGLKAGQDFSVTGYDDIAEAMLWNPALTTQRVPCEVIGREAVRLLLRRIAEPRSPVERFLVPLDFQIRGTTTKPLSARWLDDIRRTARNASL